MTLSLVPKTNKAPDTRAHARYGPSGMKKIIECPVSPFLEKDFENTTSEYAKEGHRAHSLAENYLAQILQAGVANVPVSLDFKFKTPEPTDGKPFDGEMIRHCRGYALYCYEVVKPFLGLKHEWFIEKRLMLDEDLDIWGTADFVFVYQMADGNRGEGSHHLIIIDLKYGMGVEVDTEENWQLGTYSLAGLNTFSNREIVDAETHIFQPRTDHDITPQLIPRQELIQKYATKILEKVSISEGFFARKEVTTEELGEYQRAGDWCRFCRAKGICKAYANRNGVGRVLDLYKRAKPSLDAMQKANDVEHKENMDTYKAIVKANPAAEVTKPEKINAMEDPKAIKATGIFTDEDLSFLALNAGNLSKFIDAAVDCKKDLLKAGEKSAFVMLGKATPVRAWIDDEEKLLTGLIELGVPDPVEQVNKFISLTAAEKVIGKGKIDDLTQVVRETVRIAALGSDVEPAPPRGLDIGALLGVKR